MSKNHSPIGATVSEHIQRKLANNKDYREAYERLLPFEQIARIAIMRRAQLGLSQQQVAERMGTTTSVISRIESGQHRTSTETLRRLAEALEGHAVLGFEFQTDGEPERELIAL
jgi:ribosome-binding protein aMBF1 (putative translation factor)